MKGSITLAAKHVTASCQYDLLRLATVSAEGHLPSDAAKLTPTVRGSAEVVCRANLERLHEAQSSNIVSMTSGQCSSVASR